MSKSINTISRGSKNQWAALYRPLSLVSLLCISAAAVAAKPAPSIQGVGFLCNETADCQVSTIRHAVKVKVGKGDSVILGVGASIASTDTVNWPITPILFSSASPGQLHELPAVGTDIPNQTFLIASMITPDGLHIASRAQYNSGNGAGRTAVIVDVLPGNPEFSAPTFANTLLDPAFSKFRSAASNISDDGTVAYGFGSGGNFIWTQEAGLALLPTVDLGSGSTIGGSNAADGSKVTVSDYGCDDTCEVFFQTGNVYDRETNSYTRLQPLPDDDSIAPFAMSANGKVVVGASFTSTRDEEVEFVSGQLVRWDAQTGAVEALGSPNTGWQVSNFGGITRDGKAILVNFGDWDPVQNSYTQHPYLRNKNGFFELEVVLADAGVDLSGWLFTFDEDACIHCLDAGGTSIFGVSPDGDLIFGGALHEVGGEWVPEGFIISDLPNNHLQNYGKKKSK